MAVAIDYNTAKSWVIDILQASQTPWGTTIDNSNRQYNSDTAIAKYILTADGEICTLIANTPLHPYQTQFVVAPASKVNGDNVPLRNGMILRVTGQMGLSASQTFLNTDISTTTDLVTKASHGLITGQQVQLTTTGGLPTGLGLSTTYYIYRASSSTYGFSTTLFNAKAGTLIDITGQGTGTNTVTTQFTDIYEADSKNTITELNLSPYLFAKTAGNAVGFWKMEGDTFYTNCPACKIYYTDYVLTASPQAPEPLLGAVVFGAVSKALKDGGDAQLAEYYLQQYQAYLQQIASGAKLLPEISMAQMAA